MLFLLFLISVTDDESLAVEIYIWQIYIIVRGLPYSLYRCIIGEWKMKDGGCRIRDEKLRIKDEI